MEIDNVASIIVTAITVLGSTTAWNYYEKRMKIKQDQHRDEAIQQNMFRDDLRERVAILESKLESSYREREELQSELRKLAESTAAMRVEIDFLRKENESLKRQLHERT